MTEEKGYSAVPESLNYQEHWGWQEVSEVAAANRDLDELYGLCKEWFLVGIQRRVCGIVPQDEKEAVQWREPTRIWERGPVKQSWGRWAWLAWQ